MSALLGGSCSGEMGGNTKIQLHPHDLGNSLFEDLAPPAWGQSKASHRNEGWRPLRACLSAFELFFNSTSLVHYSYESGTMVPFLPLSKVPSFVSFALFFVKLFLHSSCTQMWINVYEIPKKQQQKRKASPQPHP